MITLLVNNTLPFVIGGHTPSFIMAYFMNFLKPSRAKKI